MSQADQKNQAADPGINQAALDEHAISRLGRTSVERTRSTATRRVYHWMEN